MNVTLIGSGNVATVLGRLIKQKGHTIKEIISKNISNATKLAGELAATPLTDVQELSSDSDIYIIAVSDTAIIKITNQLHKESLVVHTSGAVSKNILRSTCPNYGILYPVQSLRKEILRIPEIPFLIDGNNDSSKRIIKDFAESISAFVEEAEDEKRLLLHIAAVTVSNFTNHLYALAEDFCNNEKISFPFLSLLIEETASRISNHHPMEMQTGPAVRGDIETIGRHLALIDNYPDFKKVYWALSESILKFNGIK